MCARAVLCAGLKMTMAMFAWCCCAMRMDRAFSVGIGHSSVVRTSCYSIFHTLVLESRLHHTKLSERQNIALRNATITLEKKIRSNMRNVRWGFVHSFDFLPGLKNYPSWFSYYTIYAFQRQSEIGKNRMEKRSQWLYNGWLYQHTYTISNFISNRLWIGWRTNKNRLKWKIIYKDENDKQIIVFCTKYLLKS